nr:hypothetical protein [Tanacetum cinerariifolium]
MKEYFKIKWKEMCRMENVNDNESEDDLVCDENEATNNLVADEIDGVDTRNAHGMFLPFVISDRIHVVVTIPEGLKKKRGSFIFVNYIADKEEFADSSNDELKLLYQKAKLKWLSEGDQNIAYFYGILKSRKHKGRIESIYDENDMIFDNVLSKEEAKDMIGIVTNEEIKEAVFDIDSNKVSGPNGYTSGFFKKHIVLLAMRHIQDNILIAQELLKGHQRKKRARRCAIKIGIQKNYTFSSCCLSMKYRGIPLIAEKLGINDCKSLVDKVAEKINCWKNKEIEKLLKGFLWCQGPLTSGKAKVARKQDLKGPLCDIIPKRYWYMKMYSEKETVADMINNGVCIWPMNWYNKYPELCNIAIPTLSDGAKEKCLHSSEYLSALGAAIGKAIEKGMQDGLAVRITHGVEGMTLADVAAYNPSAEVDYFSALQRLQNIIFSLLAELRVVVGATSLSFSLDVSDARVRKIRENIASQRLVLRDVFTPIYEPFSAEVLTGTRGTSDIVHAPITMALSVTSIFTSTILPISTDDYEIAHTEGEEDAVADVEAIADEGADPFPDVSGAELDVLE